jgi:hypothetical protein
MLESHLVFTSHLVYLYLATFIIIHVKINIGLLKPIKYMIKSSIERSDSLKDTLFKKLIIFITIHNILHKN